MVRANTDALATINTAILVNASLPVSYANGFRGAPLNAVRASHTSITVERNAVQFTHMPS